MADYIMRGTRSLLRYKRTLASEVPNERLAATIGIPLIHMNGAGVDGPQFVSAKYKEAQAQALAALLGVSVANVTTNGGQEIVG